MKAADEPLVDGADDGAALAAHDRHHLLQAQVATDATDDQDAVVGAMGHGALGDLDQHGKYGLLQRIAQVGLGALAGGQQGRRLRLDKREQTGERHVHALDDVGQVDEFGAMTRHLLDVVAGRRVIGQVEVACEPVQAVADGDVDRLAEDPVAPVGVRDDLGVTAADVEHGWVLGARHRPAHFNVSDAVVDRDDGPVPHLAQQASDDGDRLQRSTHAGSLGEGNQVDGGCRDAGVVQRLANQRQDPGLMVLGGLAGQEPGPRRRHKRVADVGQDRALVVDNANPELVRRTLQAQDKHGRRQRSLDQLGCGMTTAKQGMPFSAEMGRSEYKLRLELHARNLASVR